jgi:hypothetical protein
MFQIVHSHSELAKLAGNAGTYHDGPCRTAIAEAPPTAPRRGSKVEAPWKSGVGLPGKPWAPDWEAIGTHWELPNVMISQY